jgi:hypothetical protein
METPMADVDLCENRIKYVYRLRHKRQGGFVPRAEEMVAMNSYSKELEDFEDLDANIIEATKVHKLLKFVYNMPLFVGMRSTSSGRRHGNSWRNGFAIIAGDRLSRRTTYLNHWTMRMGMAMMRISVTTK